MAKARAGGPDYIYSLLTGYEDPPAGVEVPPMAATTTPTSPATSSRCRRR